MKYAKERKAFGKSIAEFGMIQHKLAEMAIRIFATESTTYRVVGLIENELEDSPGSNPDAAQTMLKAVEEFAAECSYIKIFASEMLDYVVDEGVQIHGGYGYHQDYAVERAYRDSRINRIFEGTNEINRLLATGMLLKRAQRGQLPLVEAVKKLQAEILAGPTLGSGGDEDARLVDNAKKIGAVRAGRRVSEVHDRARGPAGGAGRRSRTFSMNAFAMESALLRTQKLVASKKGEVAAEMCRGVSCARPWRRWRARRARCWRRVRKATRCARIWRC